MNIDHSDELEKPEEELEDKNSNRTKRIRRAQPNRPPVRRPHGRVSSASTGKGHPTSARCPSAGRTGGPPRGNTGQVQPGQVPGRPGRRCHSKKIPGIKRLVRCTLSLLFATSYLKVYSVRAVKTAKIDRLPPRFFVALYSAKNKLILLWSICVSASSCHSDDRILTACYRAASCWEGL